MWESLLPERVEAFANDIRTKILSLAPLQAEEVKKYRSFWDSLQPGNLTDRNKNRLSIRPWTSTQSDKRCYFTRLRVKANQDKAAALLHDWAQQNDIELKEAKKTYYNTYFIGIKQYNGKALSMHIVTADVVEDPGNVHISLRCYANPKIRGGAEADMKKAVAALQSDGRKLD